MPPTILCVASYEKGHDFLRQCKRSGWRVFLLTSLSLKDVARWPTESIDEIFYMPDVDKKWNVPDTVKAVSFLARTEVVDRIVPLEDFDLELCANLREHLRVPGMGDTTTRYFRDKLAMRVKAKDEGVLVPDFVHVLNHAQVRAFTERVAPPWVLKPRTLAGAIGVKRVRSAEELWARIEQLGDEQSFYLLERYVPGDVFHVDSVVNDREVRFACASGYGKPPLDVSHDGDVFSSRLLERGSPTERGLLRANADVVRAMGLVRGASHTEFIRAENGSLYFLETAARVGGAHIAELVEAATGLNPWAEWAKVELAGGVDSYAVPAQRSDYAGLIVSLAKQEQPDLSAFADPEVVWRLVKRFHVGLIVRSPRYERITELMDQYVERIRRDYHAYAPPPDRPTD